MIISDQHIIENIKIIIEFKLENQKGIYHAQLILDTMSNHSMVVDRYALIKCTHCSLQS